MRKFISRKFNILLALPLIWATVMCCQFSAMPKNAEAANAVKGVMPSCHAAAAEKSSAPVKKECTCCVTKQFQIDPPAKISLNVPKVIIDYLSFDVSRLQSLIQNTSFDLAYLNGPPGSVLDIPIYIQTHNFRI